MANQEKSLIVMVLDRSGSMGSIRHDTIGGINTFWEDQKKVPGKCFVTLVQFDTEYEVVFQNQPLQTVRPMDEQSFVPRGSTALFDAIAKTINSTVAELAGMDEQDKPGKIFFVTITDGEENASREYVDREKIFEMITHHREALGWQFIYLGANQDAMKSGVSLGYTSGSSMTYACTSGGTAATYDILSKKLWETRSGTTSEVLFDDEDRKEATKL
jgi:Mg-chelatase subunit ChlD